MSYPYGLYGFCVGYFDSCSLDTSICPHAQLLRWPQNNYASSFFYTMNTLVILTFRLGIMPLLPCSLVERRWTCRVDCGGGREEQVNTASNVRVVRSSGVDGPRFDQPEAPTSIQTTRGSSSCVPSHCICRADVRAALGSRWSSIRVLHGTSFFVLELAYI